MEAHTHTHTPQQLCHSPQGVSELMPTILVIYSRNYFFYENLDNELINNPLILSSLP